MSDEIVWATSLRKPLPKWGFPNGVARDVCEVDALAKKLLVAIQADPGNETKVRELLRTLVPTATDDDWESMTAEDVQNLWNHAQQKDQAIQEFVDARRKNVDAGKAKTDPTPSRPSSPTTTSRTSRRKSRGATTNPTGPSA